MPDNLSPEQRRKTMQAVKSKGTNLENVASRELWRRGFRFRRNVGDLFGKPDFAVKKYRAVVFIDSCFWHGCELHCKLPVNNREFWRRKIDRNRRRDEEVTAHYLDSGWGILRVWEHDIRADLPAFVDRVEELMRNAKAESEGSNS